MQICLQNVIQRRRHGGVVPHFLSYEYYWRPKIISAPSTCQFSQQNSHRWMSEVCLPGISPRSNTDSLTFLTQIFQSSCTWCKDRALCHLNHMCPYFTQACRKWFQGGKCSCWLVWWILNWLVFKIVTIAFTVSVVQTGFDMSSKSLDSDKNRKSTVWNYIKALKYASEKWVRPIATCINKHERV